jgi:hypothetical protein
MFLIPSLDGHFVTPITAFLECFFHVCYGKLKWDNRHLTENESVSLPLLHGLLFWGMPSARESISLEQEVSLT